MAMGFAVPACGNAADDSYIQVGDPYAQIAPPSEI